MPVRQALGMIVMQVYMSLTITFLARLFQVKIFKDAGTGGEGGVAAPLSFAGRGERGGGFKYKKYYTRHRRQIFGDNKLTVTM